MSEVIPSMQSCYRKLLNLYHTATGNENVDCRNERQTVRLPMIHSKGWKEYPTTTTSSQQRIEFRSRKLLTFSQQRIEFRSHYLLTSSQHERRSRFTNTEHRKKPVADMHTYIQARTRSHNRVYISQLPFTEKQLKEAETTY